MTTSFRPVPWSGKDLLIGMVAAIVLVIAPVAALNVATGAWALTEDQVALLRGPAIALAEMLLLLPPVFTLWRYRRGWQWLGFRPYRWTSAVGLGCLFLGVSFVVNLLWSTLMGLYGLETQPNYLPLFGSGIAALAWALFGGAIVAPIAEEAFFRGFLFAGLRDRFGLAQGVVISAALFSVVHFTPTAVVPIFVLGLLLALLYEASDSLWPGIAMHSTINFLALTASYVALNRPPG